VAFECISVGFYKPGFMPVPGFFISKERLSCKYGLQPLAYLHVRGNIESAHGAGRRGAKLFPLTPIAAGEGSYRTLLLRLAWGSFFGEVASVIVTSKTPRLPAGIIVMTGLLILFPSLNGPFRQSLCQSAEFLVRRICVRLRATP
jgi:hypothetical protein